MMTTLVRALALAVVALSIVAVGLATVAQGPSPASSDRTTAPPRFADTTQQGQQTYRETGNVVRVTNGDTLRVRLRSGAHVSVRMLGIDTPERGRCGAAAATASLRRLAPVGSTVGRRGAASPGPTCSAARRLPGTARTSGRSVRPATASGARGRAAGDAVASRS